MKPNTVHVKPREGARIRQPERNGAVMDPEKGAIVRADDVFYVRLINSKDLVVVEGKQAAKDEAREETPPATAKSK